MRIRPAIAFTAAAGAVAASNERLRNDTVDLYRATSRTSLSVYHALIVAEDYKRTLDRLKKYRDHENKYLSPEHRADYRKEKHQLDLRVAERILDVCLRQGGVYIKFGQHMASMNHAIPDEYTQTLSKLQDKAQPVSFEAVERALESELGAPVESLFESFDRTPLAAASLAQVHRAKTKEGNDVAVKVQYPHLVREAAADLSALRLLFRAANYVFPGFSFNWLLDEFDDTLKQEFNFITEGCNAETAASAFRHQREVYVPEVVWPLSTPRVLTMEFIEGCKVNDVGAIVDMGLQPQDVCSLVCDAFARMVFHMGLVHCDLHPGNMMVRRRYEGGKGKGKGCATGNGKPFAQLVLLDHGLYRRLDPSFLRTYSQLWRAMLLRDEEKVMESATALGVGEFYEYLPLIFTHRFINSTGATGKRMDKTQQKELQEKLKALEMWEYSEFFSSLPRDMLFVMRSGELVRSINKELGGSTMARYLTLGRAAVLASVTPHSTSPQGGGGGVEDQQQHMSWWARVRYFTEVQYLLWGVWAVERLGVNFPTSLQSALLPTPRSDGDSNSKKADDSLPPDL